MAWIPPNQFGKLSVSKGNMVLVATAPVSPPMETGFGAWLESARERRGWTQEVFASRAGTTAATISRIESGERNPSREMVERIALALATDEQDPESVQRLVQEAKRVAAGLPVEEYDPDLTQLRGLYEGLSPGSKKRVVEITRLLRDAERDASIGGRGYRPDGENEKTGDTDPEA